MTLEEFRTAILKTFDGKACEVYTTSLMDDPHCDCWTLEKIEDVLVADNRWGYLVGKVLDPKEDMVVMLNLDTIIEILFYDPKAREEKLKAVPKLEPKKPA